jgi:TPR repeat protein
MRGLGWVCARMRRCRIRANLPLIAFLEGVCHLQGRGVVKNQETAAYLFAEAAALDYAKAQLQLGW